MVEISFPMILILGLGWIVSIIILILTILLIKLTPAWTFLKANLGRKAVVFIKNRSGLGDFRAAKVTNYGCLSVEGHGIVVLSENSKTLDRKSKVPIFNSFSEFGATLSHHYEPTIENLRKKGYKIDNFEDLRHLIYLSTSEEYASAYLSRMKKEEDVEKTRKLIEAIKKEKIEIKPFKTYGINELGHMFPFNMSSVYMEEAITAETIIANKKDKRQMQMYVTFGIVALLVLVGAAIAYKMITGGGQPEVVVKVLETGVQQAVQNTSVSM